MAHAQIETEEDIEENLIGKNSYKINNNENNLKKNLLKCEKFQMVKVSKERFLRLDAQRGVKKKCHG